MSRCQDDTIIIKSILNIRCREGSTVHDITNEYKEISGENWFYADKTPSEAFSYLKSIDAVWTETGTDGVLRFYINSEKSKHISELISKQKKHDNEKKILTKHGNVKGNCFFQDNNLYRRNSKRRTQKRLITKEKKTNFIVKAKKSNDSVVQIIGDDVFVKMVIWKYAASSKRNKSTRYIHLCKSGLSILETAKYFECTRFDELSTVVINIGMEDILRGSSISSLCSNFDNLINVCIKNGFTPIISTLAPLPHANHSPFFHKNLQYFNNFLLDNYSTQYDIIDHWSEMTTKIAYQDEI